MRVWVEIIMNGIRPLLFGLLLSTLLVACGQDIGEECGGFTLFSSECKDGYFCCQPDYNVADVPGICVSPDDLADEGEVCGVAADACCISGTYCDTSNDDNGEDGICTET